MPRTFIGLDSTGAACIKVTKNSADDPCSTPDAQRSKFHYNSKDHKVAVISAVVPELRNETGGSWDFGGGGVYYYGLYFNPDQYVYQTAYAGAAFPDLDYDCPLVDYKYKDEYGRGVDLQYFSGTAGLSEGGGYTMIGARTNYFLPGTASPGGQSIGGNETQFIPATGYSYPIPSFPAGTLVPFGRIQSFGQVEKFPTGSAVAIVWNLPGDSASVNQAAPVTPTPGQKVIEINPGALKITKPGYDVATATRQQLAFSAEKKPVKVISSGDIAIGASTTTTFDIGFTVDASVYLDVQYYASGGEIYYPADPSTNYYGARYYVSGSTIYFENDGAACRARFIVIAVDQLGPSSGSNKVFQMFEEGGQKVVRLLAPGSGDPPRLSDIVMDSRWPTMPILAEGYVSVSGVETFNIDFDNLGMKPFVKLSVLKSYNGSIVAAPPIVRRLLRPGYGMGGDTVYGRITSSDTRLVISTFRGLPINAFLASTGVVEWYMPEVVGVRYYVFGIPA